MLDGMLLGLALLCAAYFVVIVIYAGIGTSFAFIWLFFAAALVFLVYGKWYYRANAERIPRWLPVSVVTTCIAGVVILAVLCVLVFLGAAVPDRPGLDYVIVLGAKVKENNTVSNSLKKRLDKAVLYAQENPETYLVLSGGRGRDEQASEAEVMYDYLVYNGVEPRQLLLEEHSASTVENVAYSKVIINHHRTMLRREREKRESLLRQLRPAPGPDFYTIVEDKPLEVGVLTSNFHIFRATQIAEKWGFKEVCGISAQSDPVLFIHLCVRECASIFKDKLMGNM